MLLLLQGLTLIKLGGSVVTFKEKPLAANINAIDGISRALTQLDVPVIIVHGGGSFGHYWSVKYDMHTKSANYDTHGVSIVYVGGTKYSILSGDALMTILARVLRPLRIIFATNVDGVYKDRVSRELVNEIQIEDKRSSIEFFKASDIDATGGMQRKVTEAFKIASHGMDVVMINGLLPERIIDAAEGKLKVGTLVKGRKS